MTPTIRTSAWATRTARILRGLALGAAFAGAAGDARAQAPTLKDVLRRAHTYVVEYEDRLSAVLAEERYEQRIIDAKGTVERKRTLVSDCLVFQLPPDETWFAFRDVFEVDGQRVRDRQERFQMLFAQPPEDVVSRAEALHAEAKRPTLITTPSGVELKTRGRFWVESVSGRVIRSQLMAGGARAMPDRATITVTYRLDPLLGLWVPAEMTEIYDNPRTRDTRSVTGTATYANFRRLDLKARIKPRT